MLLLKTMPAFALALFVFVCVFQSVKMGCDDPVAKVMNTQRRENEEKRKPGQKSRKKSVDDYYANPHPNHVQAEISTGDDSPLNNRGCLGRTIRGAPKPEWQIVGLDVLHNMENLAKNVKGFKESFAAYILKEKRSSESVNEMEALLDKVVEKQESIISKFKGQCFTLNEAVEQINAAAKEYLCKSDTYKRATLTKSNRKAPENDAKELAKILQQSASQVVASLDNLDNGLITFKENFDHHGDSQLAEKVDQMKGFLGQVKIKNGEFREGLNMFNENREHPYGQIEVDQIIRILKAYVCEVDGMSQRNKADEDGYGQLAAGHKSGKSVV